jgi:hypothetical protein
VTAKVQLLPLAPLRLLETPTAIPSGEGAGTEDVLLVSSKWA